MQKTDEAVAAQGAGARSKQPCDDTAANSAPVPDGSGRKALPTWISPFGCRRMNKLHLLQKFDFQPMKISFEFVEEKQFAEVLYPQNMYDLIDFSLRECIRQRIAMRTCKNCGKYFALTVHGSTEYCSRVFDSRGRTCKEVGAMRQYLQSHAQDELLKIYRREYKRRFAWIRAGENFAGGILRLE